MTPALRSVPTPLDRAVQVFYRCAYRAMRVYWKVRRPHTHGALVALWEDDAILLIRNSYVPYYCIPGGYVGRNETSRAAAIRELCEEVGVMVEAARLELVFDEVNEFEGKRDHVEIFSLSLDTRPMVQVDHREVIEAIWVAPERALELELFPPLRRVIEQREQARLSPGALDVIPSHHSVRTG